MKEYAPKKIRKAVIAAAGLGTRFLPQTKAMPKEMLPIMGKPIIQWVVEELVGVGVTDIIIVTGAQKRTLEDHFDRSFELEEELRKKGKNGAADEIQKISELANFIYIRQKAYNGYHTGTAIPMLNAAHIIGDEPFFFVSGDDLFVSEQGSRAKQMLTAYQKTGKSIIASLEIDPIHSEKYGMVDIKREVSDGLYALNGLIEKPKPIDAPSNMMTIMWYLVTPNIFSYAKKLTPGKGGELQAADAIDAMAKDDDIYALKLDGTYHDCGDYMNYLKTSLYFASQYGSMYTDISRCMQDVLLKEDTIKENSAKKGSSVARK